MMQSVKSSDASGQVLVDDIIKKIESGILAPGEALLPMRRLVEKYGISMRATLNGISRLAEEGWVLRQHGAGVFVCEKKELPEIFCIGILRDIQSLFAPQFDSFIQALAAEKQFDIVDCSHAPAENIHCMLCLGYTQKDYKPLNLACPIIAVAPNFPQTFLGNSKTDIITGNYAEAAYAAGDFARRSGAESPVLVQAYMNDAGNLNDIIRIRAFALGFGQPLDSLQIMNGRSHTPTGGAALVPDLLKLPAGSFVFCTSDDLAIGICDGLLANGENPGKRLRVMGLDGQPCGVNESYTLTTMELEEAPLIDAVLDLLRKRCDDPQRSSVMIQTAMKFRTGNTT
ncbi:MAG: GntR family transcriptional regulator [Planctomycetota bacterium]|jgi:DNA-binding transcriptional regulator YhcF (GntR family)